MTDTADDAIAPGDVRDAESDTGTDMYFYKTRIRYSEVGGDGRLTIVGLVNHLQDCATFHSEDTGFGLQWLMERHHGWFVTSYHIRMEDMPMMGEEVIVSTFPVSVRGMIGERHYTVTSADGKHMYARAKSIWVYMDIAESKPSRIPDGMAEAYGKDEPPTDEDWGSRKIRQMEDREPVYDFTVSHLFIDSNHHMNNAYYIEAARKALPDDASVNDIRIEYRSPAKLGDTVHVELAKDGEKSQVFLLSDDGTVYSVVEFN